MTTRQFRASDRLGGLGLGQGCEIRIWRLGFMRCSITDKTTGRSVRLISSFSGVAKGL